MRDRKEDKFQDWLKKVRQAFNKGFQDGLVGNRIDLPIYSGKLLDHEIANSYIRGYLEGCNVRESIEIRKQNQ